MTLAEEGRRVIAEEGEYQEPSSSKPKKRGRKARVEEPPFQYIPNEASVKTCTIFASILMRVLCRVAKWEPTTEEEEIELGRAIDPVLQKRLPVIAGWGEEIALAMVIVGIVAPRVLKGSQAVEIEEEEEIPPEKVIVVEEKEVKTAVEEATIEKW